MSETRHFAKGTSITRNYPWGLNVKARVLCSDGKVRATARLAETADTFFSIPAAVKVKGKTVAGFVTLETLKGYSVESEGDPAVLKFVPYLYRKNGDLLPKWRHEEVV